MKRVVFLALLGIVFMTFADIAFAGNVTQTTGGYIPSLGEQYYRYTGAGARGFAMGDALTGLTDDVNSGTYNPAGLWIIEGPVVSFSFNSVIPRGEAMFTFTPVKTDIAIQDNGLGHFSFATPMRIKGHPFVFDFNFQHSNDYVDELDYVTDLTGAYNPNAFWDNVAFLRAFSFGLSTRIYKQLSIGFLTNIYDGQNTTKLVVREGYDSIVRDGAPPETIWKYKQLTEIDSTRTKGANFTLGAMYKFEKFNLGLVVQTPFQMSNERDYIRDSLAMAGEHRIVDESGTRFIDNYKTKEELPLSGTFGIGITPNEDIKLGIDITYQNYGSVDYYQLDSSFYSANGDRTDYFSSVPIGWNNTIGIGIGGEYLLETGFGKLPLRAGLRYDQIPRAKNYNYDYTQVLEMGVGENEWLLTNDVTEDINSSERQNNTSISLGTGINWSQIEISIGYRYTTGAEENVTDTYYYYRDLNDDGLADLDENNQPIKDSFSIKSQSKYKTHEIRLTFIGRF